MRSLSDIRKITRFCRKNGILKFKDGDFEIELKSSSMAIADPGLEIKNDLPGFPPWDSLTAEQQLLWSATPQNVQS